MSDWREIKTQADIDALDQEICGFHDSCIVGIDYKTGTFVSKDRSMHMGWQPEDYTLLLSLDTQLSGDVVELLFFRGAPSPYCRLGAKLRRNNPLRVLGLQ